MQSKEDIKNRIIVIAGMPRAGTTFLYHNMQKHPDIFVPVRKEIGYFSYNYDRTEKWYFDFFRDMKRSQVSFDISGMYFFDENICERILKFNPEAKIILGVREPSEWIFSLYEQYKGNFQVPPFPEFLNGFQVDREGKEIPIKFDNNFIKTAIGRFIEYFGQNLLLYDFSLLKNDSLALLRGIENFCGLSSFFRPGNYNDSKINARGRRRTDFFFKFMHKKGVVNLILELFPRKMILAARNFIDGYSARKIKRPENMASDGCCDEEIHVQIQKLFSDDSQYIKELFEESSLVLGSGHSFKPVDGKNLRQ